MRGYRFLRNGDKAITMELGNTVNEGVNRQVTAICSEMMQQQVAGIVDLIPTFRSLTVCFEPGMIREWKVKSMLKKAYRKSSSEGTGTHRVVCIPVCYGKEYGPDLAEVAAYHNMTEEEIVRLHCGRDYLIYMLGFLPGFPYLGGMDEKLTTPRLDSPRVLIEPGSVGIGGGQTGIYPMASPGGWRLIGRTPVRLYDSNKEDSVPYEAGDYIRFVPVTQAQYREIEQEIEAGTYKLLIEEGR